jgi:repressor LexA
MTKVTLTKRQREILKFILQNIAKQGFPPTIPEIQKKFDFNSPTAVNDHLAALQKKGYIARQPFTSRGIRVIGTNTPVKSDTSSTIQVPIVGRVAAGAPILAEENVEGYLSVDKSLTQQTKNIFALKVRGDSMIKAGIFDGDYVIVNKQSIVNQGEIAAVLIDDEATIKRVYINASEIKLQPENDSLEPTILDLRKENVSIVGKVKAVIRKLY